MAEDRKGEGDIATLRRDPDRWATGDEPMTSAQGAYLRTLCREAREPFDETLTKAEASRRIDALRHRTGREESAPGPEIRTTAEVLADHLRRRGAGDLEEDLRLNYAEDVVVLSASGAHYGHDGVRYLTLLLREELPEPTFSWRTVSSARELALVEWEAHAADGSTEEGVDTYLIRNGRIVAQTVHVRSWR